MTDERPTRRAADGRIDDLARDVSEIKGEMRSIREMLITEPEASPLGRALLKYASENRMLITKHHEEMARFIREDFQPLDDWWNRSQGAWKLVLGIGAVGGIVGTFFGLASYFGFGN